MEFSVLSNNLKMPMMGFGVFQVTDKNFKQSVLNAIPQVIDSSTPAVYGNEDAVVKPSEAISEVYVPEMIIYNSKFQDI